MDRHRDETSAALHAIRIAGLGPLSPPGYTAAGRELRDGMQAAVQTINDAGGMLGTSLELVFRDTGGTPPTALAAVEALRHEGIVAFAGEFHSVVADAIVEPIQQAGIPFMCASATLDAITARRLDCVFRLAPAQSYGWRIYADFLVAEGFRQVVALTDPSVYWEAGARVLERRLVAAGVRFSQLTVPPEASVTACVKQIAGLVAAASGPHMLLLLVAYPEPVHSLVHELYHHGLRPPRLYLGDPAGRAAFADWWVVAGAEATQMPFLAYIRSDHLTTAGERMRDQLTQQRGQEPTFVAFEGYDSVWALAQAINAAGSTGATEIAAALRRIAVQGTRGSIRFTTSTEAVVHQQWTWPPVCVLAFHEPDQPFSTAAVLWDARAVHTKRTRLLRG